MFRPSHTKIQDASDPLQIVRKTGTLFTDGILSDTNPF